VGDERSHAEWVRLLRDGGAAGRAVHEELRAALLAGVRRVFGRRGATDDVCEDFVQEALMKVRERLDDFRGESRFTTWALAIATRVGFDEMRRKRWKDVSFEEVTKDARAPIPLDSAEAPADRALVRSQVLKALHTVIEGNLTEKQRTVLVAELQGMPHEEIARRLGMNRNALYKLSHDARRKVKAQLEVSGMTAADVTWAFQ